tara:strand:- start:2526 stop:2903 length:378 start_codon:yes stop_codon:yes gene_type:complete
MEIHGKIKEILPLESGVSKAGNEWKKQSVLIDTGDDYNPIVLVNAFGEEKIKSLNRYKEGDTIDISCNVYSREFKGKYYTSIDGYWFANKNAEVHPENQKNDLKESVAKIANPEFVTSEDTDLPF